MNNADIEPLYAAVGDRIRKARESQAKRLSQAALAERLGVSRASVVNIEAGRQHAPLSLLWKIAEQLDVELTALIPTRDELTAPPVNLALSDVMRDQLKQYTNGDAALETNLSHFIAQAVIQLSGGVKSAPRKTRKRTS